METKCLSCDGIGGKTVRGEPNTGKILKDKERPKSGSEGYWWEFCETCKGRGWVKVENSNIQRPAST
jgi:DnaJ-class molecular chaperone